MNQVLEPRFTAESMATLLSIPVGKRLLRRHLANAFRVIGWACLHECERNSIGQWTNSDIAGGKTQGKSKKLWAIFRQFK